jgi:hypothetical protein
VEAVAQVELVKTRPTILVGMVALGLRMIFLTPLSITAVVALEVVGAEVAEPVALAAVVMAEEVQVLQASQVPPIQEEEVGLREMPVQVRLAQAALAL